MDEVPQYRTGVTIDGRTVEYPDFPRKIEKVKIKKCNFEPPC